jgi:hypothetical protein
MNQKDNEYYCILNDSQLKDRERPEQLNTLEEFLQKVKNAFCDEDTSRIAVSLECEEIIGQFPFAKITYKLGNFIYTTKIPYDNLIELRKSWQEDSYNPLRKNLNDYNMNLADKKIHIKPSSPH